MHLFEVLAARLLFRVVQSSLLAKRTFYNSCPGGQGSRAWRVSSLDLETSGLDVFGDDFKPAYVAVRGPSCPRRV